MSTRTHLVGAHTPNGDPSQEAAARQADLVQVFLSNPQGWRKPQPRPDAAELTAGDLPIYVHAPYLVNVCADSSRVRIPSRRILQETCDAAAAIGAVGVVVHGGHVTGPGEVAEGVLRWRKALEQLDSDVPVLIENTAGGDRAMARRVDQLALLWPEIADLGPGFVLDTCHAWAGGEPVREVVERVIAVTGRIDLLHLNDSRDGFDSRRDRHANVGQGEMAESELAAAVRSVDAPIVVETPGGAAGQAADIAWAKAVLAG